MGQPINRRQMSERHARTLVWLSRDSYRNAPVASAQTEALKNNIVEIAHARGRFGYRRVNYLLRLNFPDGNHKRVCRLHGDAKLAVRKPKKMNPRGTGAVHCDGCLNEHWLETLP